SSAAIGTTVGTLSVLRGTGGSYTYALTSNPGGLYAISGSALQVAAALSAGSDPILIRATPTGSGATLTQPFAITVTPPASCTNGNLLLVYSDPCQLMSQMVGN